MLRNLLVYRLVIFNFFGLVLVAYGLMTGFVQKLIEGDTTWIHAAIIAVFLFALVSTFIRASKVAKGLNEIKQGRPFDASKMHVKNWHISEIGVQIITLGLIGNCLGFLVAVQGMDSVDVSGAKDALMESYHHMTAGMKIAFNCSFTAMSLGLWTLANYHILKTATALLQMDARQ